MPVTSTELIFLEPPFNNSVLSTTAYKCYMHTEQWLLKISDTLHLVFISVPHIDLLKNLLLGLPWWHSG